jgi:hypothetical protein
VLAANAVQEVGGNQELDYHRVKWALLWLVVSVLVAMVVAYEAEPFIGMTGRCAHSDGDC